MSEECTKSDCESCGESGCGHRKGAPAKEAANAGSRVKHMIAVISGKGGVGKSTVTALLANAVKQMGKNSAILDADITGPSIPKMYGITEKAGSNGEAVLPVKSKGGMPVMSINVLLEDENEPVIWRGPVISGTVRQFWTEVAWGDVDVMLVDMPPGTGDVPLTVFQSLPVDGIVVVTSPQDLVSMIVGKAVRMAQMMNVPVLGSSGRAISKKLPVSTVSNRSCVCRLTRSRQPSVTTEKPISCQTRSWLHLQAAS